MGRTFRGRDKSTGELIEAHDQPDDWTLSDANDRLKNLQDTIEWYASYPDETNGGGGGGGCLGLLLLGLPHLIQALSSEEGQYIMGEMGKYWRA